MYNQNILNRGINDNSEYDNIGELGRNFYGYNYTNLFNNQANTENMNDQFYIDDHPSTFDRTDSFYNQHENHYNKNEKNNRNYNNCNYNRYGNDNNTSKRMNSNNDQTGYLNYHQHSSNSKRHLYSSSSPSPSSSSSSASSYRRYGKDQYYGDRHSHNQKNYSHSPYRKSSSNHYQSPLNRHSYSPVDVNDRSSQTNHRCDAQKHKRLPRTPPLRRRRNNSNINNFHSEENNEKSCESSNNSSSINGSLDNYSNSLNFTNEDTNDIQNNINTVNENIDTNESINVENPYPQSEANNSVVEIEINSIENNKNSKNVEQQVADKDFNQFINENIEIHENSRDRVEENINLEPMGEQIEEHLDKNDNDSDIESDDSDDSDDSDNSDDSDDSILEIPVPPKPKPPLIDIQDSDTDADTESSESEDEIENTDDNCNVYDKEDEIDNEKENDQHQKASEGLSNNSNNITDEILEIFLSESEDLTQDRSLNGSFIDNQTVNKENEDSVHSVDNNIVLNCTVIQRGASSLDDIRKSNQTSNELNSVNEGEEILINMDSIDKITDPDEELFQVENNSLNTDELSRNISNTPINNSNKQNKNPKKRLSESSSENKIDKMNSNPAKRQKKSVKSTAEMSFEEYIFQPMPDYLHKLYTQPLKSDLLTDLQSVHNHMPKHPNNWIILNADMVRSKFNTNNNRRKKCAICQREGHLRDRCPERKKVSTCHMCGTDGHTESRCPFKMCLTCGTKYSTYRKTCEFCENLQCSSCKGIGHDINNCPDFWRGFHQTTSGIKLNIPENLLNIMKPSKKLSCCNCAKRGHDSSNCTKYRWSQHFPVSKNVISYANIPSYTPNVVIESVDDDIHSDNVTDQSIIELDDDDDTDTGTNNDNNDNNDNGERDEQSIVQFNDNNQSLIEDINSQSITEPTDPEKKQEIELSNTLIAYNNDKYTFFSSFSNIPEIEKTNWPSNVIIRKVKMDADLKLSFLVTQFPKDTNCLFEVIIYFMIFNNDEKMVKIIIKAPTLELIAGFQKIINQYLSRTNMDKYFMSVERRLPIKIIKLLRAMESSKKNFSRRSIELNLMLIPKIKIFEQELIKIKNKKVNKPKEIKKCMKKIAKLKRRVTFAAYHYSIAPEAEEIIEQFHEVIKKLASVKDKEMVACPHLKLLVAWLHYELFTPHLSSKIIHAIYNWKKKTYKNSREMIKMMDANTAVEIVNTNSHKETEQIVNNNCSRKKNVLIRKSERLAKKNESTEVNNEINSNVNIQENVIPTNSSIIAPTETPEGWEIFSKPLHSELSKLQLLNYANAAMIFAQKHNLNNLIPEVENIVKNAKLLSVKTKQIVQLWAKLKLAIKQKKK